MPDIVVKLWVDAEGAAEQVKEFNRESKESIEKAYTTGVDKAKAKLDELVRKHKEVGDTIDAEKRKLGDLEAKRTEASGTAKKQVESDIEGLKKIIATRENERIELEKKRLKLEEVGRLATATSDKEKQAVMEATSARMVELNILKDTAKAHKQVAQEIDNGIPIGRNFLTVMGGLFVVNTFIGKAQEALAEIRKEMEGINAAGAKQRDKSATQFERLKPFFDEFGLTTADQQSKAQSALNDIAKQSNLSQETVAGTAASLAPILKGAGMNDPNSDRFKSLVQNAAIFSNSGIQSDNIAAYVSGQLQENPNLTGEQLNQKLTAVRASVGGSAKYTNEMLNVMANERAVYQQEGFNDTDVQKMSVRMRERGVSVQESPELMREAFKSMGHLMGAGTQDVESMMDKLIEARMKDKSLIPLIQKGYSGKIDIRKVSEALSKMSKEDLEKAGRALGGTRGMVAMANIAGYQNVKLPNAGAMTSAPDAPDQLAKAQEQSADVESIAEDPTNPYEAGFTREVENQANILQHHPERKPWASRGVGSGMLESVGIGASDKEIAAANIYFRKYIRLARVLQDIREGKRKATPAQIDEINATMYELWRKWAGHNTGEGVGVYDTTLQDGNSAARGEDAGIDENGKPKWTSKSLLDEIGTGEQQNKWMTEHLQYGDLKSDVTSSTDAARLMERASKAENLGAPTPAPAPAPAPPAPMPGRPGASTINVHQRNIYYGTGYDSIGAALESTNRFG